MVRPFSLVNRLQVTGSAKCQPPPLPQLQQFGVQGVDLFIQCGYLVKKTSPFVKVVTPGSISLLEGLECGPLSRKAREEREETSLRVHEDWRSPISRGYTPYRPRKRNGVPTVLPGRNGGGGHLA